MKGVMDVRIGDIVLYTYAAGELPPSGLRTVPAMVVRSAVDGAVNLRLFCDAVPHGAEWRPDVQFEERAPEGNACWSFRSGHYRNEQREG